MRYSVNLPNVIRLSYYQKWKTTFSVPYAPCIKHVVFHCVLTYSNAVVWRCQSKARDVGERWFTWRSACNAHHLVVTQQSLSDTAVVGLWCCQQPWEHCITATASAVHQYESSSQRLQCVIIPKVNNRFSSCPLNWNTVKPEIFARR